MEGLPAKIGTYRVVRQLGEGGMATVFEAVHDSIERRVAIKVLHAEFARNAEFTVRFFNEVREQKSPAENCKYCRPGNESGKLFPGADRGGHALLPSQLSAPPAELIGQVGR